jgi:hypothetical protein
MSRRPSTFKQSDVTRALKGVRAAGIEVFRVEIDVNGKLVVITSAPSPDAGKDTDLDTWKAQRAREA